MALKIFIFVPDGHYAFPEAMMDKEPWDTQDLIKNYAKAKYCGYKMSGTDPIKPEREDFETKREYNEAVDEWEKENYDMAEAFFLEFNNYDVYHNTYIVLHDENIEFYPDEIFGSNFDESDSSSHETFMNYTIETEGVNCILSLGEKTEIRFNEDNQSLDVETLPNDILDFIYKYIVDSFRKKRDPKIGIVFLKLSKIINGLDQKIQSILTSDEYKSLKDLGKGGSVLSKFGIF